MKKIEILIVCILLIIDQGSKFLLESILTQGSIQIIPNFFKLDITYNTGAAWSILSGNVWFLIILSFLILGILIYMYPTIHDSKQKSISYSLLYAGTLGNLIDRIVFGYVKDFFSVRLFHYQFPVFNFADIFIVCGAILLIIVLEREEKENGSIHKRPRKRENR